MNELLLDFNKKVREINHYFRLVKFLDDKQHIDGFRITSEQQATLKANCYLLLYNLVESSIIEGLDSIFIDINQQSVSFENLSDNYKKIWLEYKYQLVNKSKQRNNKNFDSSLTEILNNLSVFNIINYTDKSGIYEHYKSYLKTLDLNNEVSGNLDARKIRELADIYGFLVPEKCDELIEVKSFRNQLAHGEKTFSKVGRERTITELIKINIQVVSYLRNVLKNINCFVENKKYLKATD